ncbi:hypothetical protein NP493_317g02007 [Ridgeia piscesae]|uniref:Tudor domain-containing protein n=1 Tax=Ridgeia piscesae TaxID=27915 RepID=A0AAD9NW01_RIDPI|nr:hypothetical protein NP493_317g02007 [Ridgeia piscesae]
MCLMNNMASQFTRDGLWYRALPYDPHGPRAHVQYIDYGTRESVHLSQMYPLEQRFCALPQQAVCCALAGIQPMSGDWPEDAAIAFRDELLVAGSVATICAYRKVQRVLEVELCRGLTPGGATINKVLLSRGFAIASTPGVAAVNGGSEKSPVRKKVAENVAGGLEKSGDAMKMSPPVRQEKKTTDRQLKSLKPGPKPASGNSPKPVSTVSPKSVPSPVKRRPVPTVAVLERLDPPMDCDQLMVTTSSGPDDITVQFVEPNLIARVQSLTKALAKMHATYSGTYTPVTGELICAKFSEDNAWYRAEVIEVKGRNDGARVRFVDYGNVEDVNVASMSALPDALLSYPAMGVKCRLSGVGKLAPGCQWDENQLKPFELWRVKIVGNERDLCSVELFDKDTGASLNALLATSASFVPLDPKKAVMNLRNVKIPDRDRIRIQVTDAVDADHVNVQILEDDYILDLARLTEELSRIEPADQGVARQPGDIVCAKYSLDDKWYRAVVLDLTDMGVKVRFIDYGNMETLPSGRIAPVTDSLMKFPIMVVSCSLSGVSGIVTRDGWTNSLKLFEPMSMTVTGRGDGGRVNIELFDDASGPSLNKKLIASGVCTAAGITAPSDIAASSDVTAPKMTVKGLKRIELTIGQTSPVQVTSAPDPDSFTLQLLDNENLPMLAKLTTELLDYTDQSESFTPCIGELMCARFSLDKNWYRAEVTGKVAGKYTVRFVDFGNEDTVTQSDIGAMTPSLMQYPVMGVCCGLADVAGVASGQTWDPEMLRPFQGLLMSVVGHKSGVPLVRLSDPKTQLDVNADLIKRGVLSPMSTPMNEPDPAAVVTPQVTIDTMARIKLPSAEKMLVQLTDTSRPGHVTVQLLVKDYLTDLANLTQVLIDTYSDYKDSYVPHVGEIVCAKFSGDWSRADVLALCPGGAAASVHFFDFGNVEEIQCADIAKITDDAILRFPVLGVSCRLGEAGAKWKPDSLPLFEAVLMTVIDPDSEAAPLVELFNAQTGSSLTEALAKSGALQCAAQTVAMSTKDDLEKAGLPRDVGQVKVRVTDAYSPSSITVQVLQGDSLAGLTALGDALNDSFCDYSSSYVPQKGELVCAKFSQDNCWYRAEVLAVTADRNIRVKFIDYGNSDEVTPGSVAKITPALCVYPVFGITCHLADVGGMASGRVWDPTLVHPFEMLSLTVESSATDGYAVKLYNDTDCLNVSLVNSGMLVGQAKGSPPKAKPKEPVQNGTSVAPLVCEQVSMPLKSSPVSCAVKTAPVVQPPSYMKCLPMQDLARDHPLVMPCYLEGPDEFYVQSLDRDCVERFTELTQALTECYGSVEAPAYEPKQKELVAAYCVADNAWYRAVVTEFYGDTHYKVVFVDYGNADLVAVNGVQQLEPRFAKLPRQAVRVSLFGMNSTDVRWSGRSISIFSEEILNKACTMSVVRKDGDVFIIADIAVDGKSVIDKMVTDGYIELSDKIANGHVTSPKSVTATADHKVNVVEAVVKISEIRVQQLVDSEEVTVLLAHMVSPSDFSVHLTENKASVEMHVKLNEYCTGTMGAYTQFVRDEVVCALYDNVWYRSVVVETPSSGGLAKLYFFDFGNTERISAENIRRMPRDFATVPQQGIPCCLGGVASAGQWSNKAVDWFSTLLNKCFKAKPLGHKDGRHQIDLRHDDQTRRSVSEEMISLQLATSIVSPGSRPTLVQRSKLSPATRKEVSPPSVTKAYQLSDLP